MQGRLRPRGAQAVGNFLPDMTTNRRARFWRVGCVLLLVLMLAARADAEPQIKVSGCEIRDTNYVDPIASTDHLRHHFGSTSTTDRSTGEASSTIRPPRATRTGSPRRGGSQWEKLSRSVASRSTTVPRRPDPSSAHSEGPTASRNRPRVPLQHRARTGAP